MNLGHGQMLKIIVTSRAQYLKGENYCSKFVNSNIGKKPTSFEEIFILPFNNDQIIKFIQNHGKLISENNELPLAHSRDTNWYIQKLRQFHFFQESFTRPTYFKNVIRHVVCFKRCGPVI